MVIKSSKSIFKISIQSQVSWSIPGEGFEKQNKWNCFHTLFKCALKKSDACVVTEEVSAESDSSHEKFWCCHFSFLIKILEINIKN